MVDPLSGEFVHEAHEVARFEPGPVVATGGMGVVHKAWDRTLERHVALKRARCDVASASLRMRREARVAAGLVHGNIVPILDHGEDADGVWLTMPWLEGAAFGDLDDRDTALRALLQAARGVGHAHANGVVHRDLKPSNLWVAADRAVVLDWGLATGQTDARLTRTGVHVGTPGYSAPEQLLGHAPAPTADVWSLGAILWTVLEGRPPHGPDTEPTLDQQVLSGSYRSLGGALGAVANRALHPMPSKRFADASAFADALAEALAPEPPPQRAPRWPLALALGTGALAVALWPAGDAPAPDVRVAHAWTLLRDGRVSEAVTLGSTTDDPAWQAVPTASLQPMGEPMACDHFDAAGGRLLCLDDGIATVMREDTRETIRTVPAVEHVGLTDDGLWWRYDVRVSLDQDGHEPWGARLVSEARAVFAGPDILLASVGDIAILLQPERPGAKQTTFPLHRPEAHWIEDGFLVLPEHDDAVFLTPDGELSPVGLPAQEGAVAGIERLGDATVVVWDRGPALVLDRELNVQHRWSLPPEAHVLATTALDGAIALQTSRHGVLVFDLSGGLLAQVDAVDAVASSGDRLYLTVNGQVQPFRLEHAGPSIWFRDQPLTSMVADAGRLATGDRHGDVSQLHPVPRTRSTRTGVVRSLWWQDDALVAHVVGAPFLLDVSGAEPVELPVEPGKKAVRLGEGYAGIGWTSGLTVYDADGTEDARWRSPVASVRTLSSRGDVALLVGTDGQIERFDVEAGVRPVGTREGARRAIDTDAGVLVGTHAEVVLLGEDDPVWASPLPGGVSALYAQGDRCVVAMDHGLVQVRSCTTGTVQLELDGHDEAVWSLAVDDGHLLTASLDGTLRRWRL